MVWQPVEEGKSTTRRAVQRILPVPARTPGVTEMGSSSLRQTWDCQGKRAPEARPGAHALSLPELAPQPARLFPAVPPSPSLVTLRVQSLCNRLCGSTRLVDSEPEVLRPPTDLCCPRRTSAREHLHLRPQPQFQPQRLPQWASCIAALAALCRGRMQPCAGTSALGPHRPLPMAHGSLLMAHCSLLMAHGSWLMTHAGHWGHTHLARDVQPPEAKDAALRVQLGKEDKEP